jgi:hypothetical protein
MCNGSAIMERVRGIQSSSMRCQLMSSSILFFSRALQHSDLQQMDVTVSLALGTVTQQRHVPDARQPIEQTQREFLSSILDRSIVAIADGARLEFPTVQACEIAPRDAAPLKSSE